MGVYLPCKIDFGNILDCWDENEHVFSGTRGSLFKFWARCRGVWVSGYRKMKSSRIFTSEWHFLLESDSILQRHNNSSTAGKHTRYLCSKYVAKIIRFAWFLIILCNIGTCRHQESISELDQKIATFLTSEGSFSAARRSCELRLHRFEAKTSYLYSRTHTSIVGPADAS